MCAQWHKTLAVLVAGMVMWWAAGSAWAGSPPPQRLPSALLAFPFVSSYTGDFQDTRIELVNLTGASQLVNCFYVSAGGDSCNEIGFLLTMTPYQPVAWFASDGFNNPLTGSLVPPFYGEGELKCVVIPAVEEADAHNAIQGRATVFASDGTTVSYGAVGFRRLSDGEFTGVVRLDGSTYTQCPERLHFQVWGDTPSSASDLVLVPCTQDLLLQSFSQITVQFLVYNEFEQPFSASTGFTCFGRLPLSTIANNFQRAILGTDTAHVIVRGVNGPLMGLAIDRLPSGGVAGNEPSFQGGRSASVVFP